VLVISKPGKKVPEHCCDLRPSEKELLEWRFITEILLVLYGSGYGLVASCCEHGIEPLGSVKSREFLD
jgi:hypothetical protein